jgi:hypothetical protein
MEWYRKVNPVNCSYCGAEYPDEMTECPVDHETVVSSLPSPEQTVQPAPMKKNATRPIATTSSQVVWVCAALVGLAFAVGAGYSVIGGLMTGRTYSLAVIFGDGTKVSMSSAPAAFWTSIGLLIVAFVGGFVVGIGVLREASVEHKRKVAAKKKQREHPSA